MSQASSTSCRLSAGGTAECGFTLVELMVVMGILTGFLMMLVQLVDSGLVMFRDGEASQVLADRASRAQRVVSRELGTLRGSMSGRDREVVEDRLLVQMLPIGVPADPARGATHVQMLRAAVHLTPERELQVVDKRLLPEILAEHPDLDAAELQAELDRRRESVVLFGFGNLMLVPWRQPGGDPALLELRAGWFLPGQRLPGAGDEGFDPFEVTVPGGDGMSSRVVYGMTEPILRDLLHVEFLFWSQSTTSWGEGDGRLLDPAATPRLQDPLCCWDSARGGVLVDRFHGGVFPFDVGPWSEQDPADDIHPHAILCRIVVAQAGDATPDGVTAGFLGRDDRVLRLADGTAFVGAPDGGFVKIGFEWIRYGALDGDRLTGLRRGQRGTAALDHESGQLVHVGRQVEFVVPILHQKDDWNHGGAR